MSWRDWTCAVNQSVNTVCELRRQGKAGFCNVIGFRVQGLEVRVSRPYSVVRCAPNVELITARSQLVSRFQDVATGRRLQPVATHNMVVHHEAEGALLPYARNSHPCLAYASRGGHGTREQRDDTQEGLGALRLVVEHIRALVHLHAHHVHGCKFPWSLALVAGGRIESTPEGLAVIRTEPARRLHPEIRLETVHVGAHAVA
eukprot:1178889-Prorocentrum_minimum.AAC.4